MVSLKYLIKWDSENPATIYGLIRIAHDEQIPVITAEYLRQRILVTADILELVHHDIHHAFLPFVAFLRIGSEDVERNGYEIIIVKNLDARN